MVVLICLSLFIRHQYSLYQHFVALEDGQLKINDGMHNMNLNTKKIRNIEYSNHKLQLKVEGLEYRFSFSGYDPLKVDHLLVQLRKETDNPQIN